MKTALVLGGGGSKGAYEIGVWKALRECGITFDLVTGTSIGAMIGTMVVQDQYDECYQLWDQLTIDDVIMNGVNLDFDIELLMSQKDRYKTILQSYITHKGADISPFEAMIEHLFDEERFFASSMDYACMSVNVSKLEPHAFTKEEMLKRVDPKDAIMASASCFPAFPMRKIHDEHYIDGGYYDNVPIKLAQSLGAEKIYAVDLKSVGTKKVWEPQENVIYIEPYVSLGSFLLFDHDQIHRNMTLGYQDAMKKLERYLGYIYTFELQDSDEIDTFEEAFEKFCSSLSFDLKHEYFSSLYHSMLTHQLLSSIKEFIEYDHTYLRVLEMLAQIFEISDEGIYRFQDFCSSMINTIHSYIPTYDRLFDESLTPKQIFASLKDFSSKDLIYYTLQRIDQNDSDTAALLKLIALAKPDTFLLAVLAHFLEIMKSA